MAKAPEIKKETYISNPFKQSFESLGRFFNTNSNWALVAIILSVFSFIDQFGSRTTNQSTLSPSLSVANHGVSVIIATVIVVFVSALALIVIAVILDIYIRGMYSYVALESEKGNNVKLRDAFRAVSERFYRLLGAELLAVAKVIGWSLLLIIPGIIAALRYSLLTYVIMDEPATEKSIVGSHNRVKQLVKGRLAEVFGILTVSIIPVVGTLLGITGNGALYRQLQIYNDKKLEKPKVHWLNYILLPIVILAALLVGLAIIGNSAKNF